MFKIIVIALIKAYQKYISPLKAPTCRFYPSCSHYAVGAVQKYGCIKGVVLASKRVIRCHPFSKGGYDPVK